MLVGQIHDMSKEEPTYTLLAIIYKISQQYIVDANMQNLSLGRSSYKHKGVPETEVNEGNT